MSREATPDRRQAIAEAADPRAAWRSFLVLAGLGFAVRAAFLLLRPPSAEALFQPLADATDYDHLARSLLAGQGFSSPTGQPTAFRPPVYPIFLAAVYTLAGQGNVLAVAWVQALLGGLSTGLIAVAARWAVLGRRTAWIAGITFALYPAFVFQSGLLLSEVLARFLLLLLLCALMRLREPRPLWQYLLAGVLYGLLILTKPVLLASVALVAAWGIWVGWRSGTRWSRWPLFLLAALLTVGVWTTRNAAVSGRLIPVATSLPFNFAKGLTRFAYYTDQWYDPHQMLDAAPDFEEWSQLRHYAGVQHELARGERFDRLAKGHIAEHPAWFAALSVRRLLHFWSPWIRNARPVQFIALATMGPVLLLGWLGVFLGLRQGNAPRVAALLALAIALPVAAVHALTLPDVRFRLALVDPLWILLAAWAAAWFWTGWPPRSASKANSRAVGILQSRNEPSPPPEVDFGEKEP